MLWVPMESPGLEPFPLPSHRFWMPLASALQAAGITLTGGLLDAFRSAQLATTLVAIAIAPATYLLARRLDLSPRASAVVAFVAGVGGAQAAAWSSLDNFAPLALLGTLLIAALPGIARGERAAILLGGVALGLIVLSRADGILYALAPVVAAFARPRAALGTLVIGALVALPWELRNLALGLPEGQLARTILLLRYEDFFRLEPPTLAAYLASLDLAVAQKMRALVVNGLTFLLATLVVLGPVALVTAARRRGDPLARGWLALVVALYLVQSLVFTLHSTAGSFSHSLSGLVPAAIALGVAGSLGLIRAARPAAAFSLVVATVAFAVYAVVLWREAFDPPLEARRAAVASGSIQTPALALNVPAWRYVLDGPALITPAEGLPAARDLARRYGARTLILEAGHASAYDALYDGRERVDWLEPVETEGAIRVWRILP